MTATDIPTTSIRALIKHMERDEHHHWKAEGEPPEHIYHDVVRVSVWLEPHPPANEAASKPNGNWASKGNWAAPNVEDDCDDDAIEAHAANIWACDKIGWEVLTLLLNTSPLPNELKRFVQDAMKAEDAGLQRLALDALTQHINAADLDKLDSKIPL